jgi:adenosine deaminase
MVMGMLRERGIVLEVCPTSNLNTRVVRDLSEMRYILRTFIEQGVSFALSTDGPEMLRSYLRDEIGLLLRQEILSLDEVEAALETANRASFVDPAPPVELTREPISAANGHAAMPVELEV